LLSITILLLTGSRPLNALSNAVYQSKVDKIGDCTGTWRQNTKTTGMHYYGTPQKFRLTYVTPCYLIWIKY